MHMKGEFRDVLKKEEKIIEDRAWKSNKIVPDFGNFLAALMKKDFKDSNNNSICMGIDYIAVGGGSKNEEDFRNKVSYFFENVKPTLPNKPYQVDGNENKWAWAKEIDPEKIVYLNSDENNKVTNTLRIEVTFDKNSPEDANSLNFEEFSLLGYNEQGTKTDSNAKLFFVNYATHGVIMKENDMTLTRTIKLTFPINRV